MKKATFLFILIVLSFSGISAQETKKPAVYVVPPAYTFDYKVTYETINEETKAPETTIYYFTKSGDYMGMQPPESQSDMDMNFLITLKDGLRITFDEEPIPANPGKNRSVMKVMDMRSLLMGSQKSISEIVSALPKKDTTGTKKKEANELDNFIKTGKTKQVFGYTAEEYAKDFTEDEKGKKRSGTMSVWYATVDFDPQMMFSMGMGSLAGEESQSKVQQSHPNNMIGMGITRKNYLLVEMDVVEKGGKSATAMKAVNIEKIGFVINTGDYYIKNYSGMNMKQIMLMEQLDR